VNRQSEPDLFTRFSEIPEPAGDGGVPLPRPRAPATVAAPERTTVRKQRLAALLASVAWVGTHLTVYGIRNDFERVSPLYVVAQVLLPFVLAIASLVVAVAPGRLGLGMKIGLISTLALLGPATFCLIAFGSPPPYAVPEGAGSLIGVLVCFDITVAWAAMPLLLAVLSLRGAFAAGSRLRSALVGAAAGLFAGATMNLHCPNVSSLHVLLGHGLPVVLAAAAGAVFLAFRTRA
jgi:hypothetical protein